MSKEQNEVLEQQRYLLERRMYRLDPAPPKLPLQECIELYFDENEDKYLPWYLHDREPMLNKLAQDACQRYGLPEHFVDIKQAAVCGILAALQKYDPSIGVPFVSFQKQYISDSIEDYIRTAQSGVITMTTDPIPSCGALWQSTIRAAMIAAMIVYRELQMKLLWTQRASESTLQ